MKSTRKLVLRSEALTELGPDQLGAVAGAASSPTCFDCPTLPPVRCAITVVTDVLNCAIHDPNSLVCSRYVC